ncbi:transcriptional regulator [Pseudomonas sp. 31-12]|uniref:helix-turn-helix domain-containing protein n=1 Tax=unclassified Pseudomonas TaxID=196821 RepID=UPI000D6ACB7A|nr:MULTISPECIES: helix-turn-helix transcriptional regulator [unclassified Pseudomonas]AWM95049.1 transcriptional regulator [Pseudomonas sp. 31-12]QZP34296.1 helix-turn-helix domain-containing protein [Pseudomonas sp. DR48]
MELNPAFAEALRELRIRKGKTQDQFASVMSREYVSMLEHGKKSPTLEKVDGLASVLGVHAVSLMVSCYMKKEGIESLSEMFALVERDLTSAR